MSRILISGAAGFLGQRLAERLTTTADLVLWDRVEAPPLTADGGAVRTVVGDLLDPVAIESALGDGVDLVVHLAAVVSAEAEADFDLGMAVNFDGTRHLLESCRATGCRPRFVMTSSVAVFGGEMPDRVPDSWAATPRSSYGVEKAMCELLVNEYSRRGFVDGRVLRLPTVVVRPGRPNKAASSFASSIIREPVNGEAAVCPVGPETPMWLMSPGCAIEALIRGCDLPASRLGDNRTISLPGLTATVGEMVEALREVSGEAAVARISWRLDPAIEAIVASWPGAFEAERARALGFEGDASMLDIVRAHVAERLIAGVRPNP